MLRRSNSRATILRSLEKLFKIQAGLLGTESFGITSKQISVYVKKDQSFVNRVLIDLEVDGRVKRIVDKQKFNHRTNYWFPGYVDDSVLWPLLATQKVGGGEV